MSISVQLSGSWLANRLGTTATTQLDGNDTKITNIAIDEIQKATTNSVDLSVTNTSWLVLKDKVSQWSNMVSVVQVASSDLDTIASYLQDIKAGYDTLAQLAEGTQAYTDKQSQIAQLEVTLSDFVGRRSVTLSDITLLSSPDGSVGNSYFQALDVDPGTGSSDQDTFAVLEVDMGTVLTASHDASTCPICKAQAAAAATAGSGAAEYANMGVSVPTSDAAPATNTTNVTGATTKGDSGQSYIEPLRKGVLWDLSAGETLSYSFYTGSVAYDATAYASASYNAPLAATAISAANQLLLDQAFSAWDSVAPFAFEKVTESGTTVGELRSAYTTAAYAGAGSAAYAYYPNSSVLGGDIWYVVNEATNSDFTPGTYGYLTALHEIGHALGLSHPFDGGSATGAKLATAVDIQRNTVMTYTQMDRNQYWVSNGSGGLTSRSFYAITPGLYDVATIEYLYGQSTTTNATNTVYSWTNWAANDPLIFRTVVDSGGADTFDASNQTRRSVIDLTPGSYSSIGIYTEAEQEAYWGGVLGGTIDLPSQYLYTGVDNVGIAFSATIENAIGGSGNDTITGNSANNALKGNGGNDTIDGGSGTDTAVFSGAKAGYSITVSGGTVTVTDTDLTNGNDGTDTLTNIESLEFSDVTYDPFAATSTATGAGAIASATAGAATAANPAAGSGSSGSSGTASGTGGGGGGGFGGAGFDTSTAIGRRNFARYKAALAAERYAQRAAENGNMAQAHLLAAQKNAAVEAERSRQSSALNTALEHVAAQKSAVARLANALYQESTLFKDSNGSLKTMIDSTNAARDVTATTADALSSASAAEKSGIASTSATVVSSLLN